MKSRYTTINTIDLKLDYLTKNQWVLVPHRDMAPIFTIPTEKKINEYENSNTVISTYRELIKEEELKDSYDNIFFKDFVLTNCTVGDAGDGIIIITADKVTLVQGGKYGE